MSKKNEELVLSVLHPSYFILHPFFAIIMSIMPARHPLSVAFVWHMHQPFYKDLVSGEYMLPWVRLHAIKDYYDMAAYMDPFPSVKAVFNVVPSLLVQIEDYVAGTAKDKFFELSLRAPEDLTLADKVFILKNFFLANWETMIKPYPRYNDLLLKRGRFVSAAEIETVAKRFSNQEMCDLQVWFNLCWFGQIYKETDPVVSGLLKKGGYFNEEDKKALAEKQIEVMRLIIPKYRQMQDEGRIELSVTPFYHPILPLLCDTEIARAANRSVKLPKNRFARPEDAAHQIKAAAQYYRDKFGAYPEGMWPSEGSVSEAVIPLAAAAGIKWMATDEAVLANSLGHRLSAQELFSPHTAHADGASVQMVFRDRKISDDIGFVYSRWNPSDAASDIMAKLHHIADILPDDDRRYLVSIILDGENAWEYYSRNGRDFFDSLYGMLSADPRVRTVRIKDFLNENPPSMSLPRLAAGSWINANFDVWLGHDEDNTSWDHLYNAREMLAAASDAPKEAWDELYIAEGSDWNWWYGDDHSSANDEDFDALYRRHLINIYKLAGKDYPKYLDASIKVMKAVKALREPVYFIDPILDGEVSNYYEWLSAGLYSVDQARGAMHQTETIIRNIYYGFNRKTLFIRIDPSIELSCDDPELKDVSFEINISKPAVRKAELKCEEGGKAFALFQQDGEKNWTKLKDLQSVGVGRVIEAGIDFSDLGIKERDEINLTVSVKRSGRELEYWPKGGVISFRAPDEDFESANWFV